MASLRRQLFSSCQLRKFLQDNRSMSTTTKNVTPNLLSAQNDPVRTINTGIPNILQPSKNACGVPENQCPQNQCNQSPQNQCNESTETEEVEPEPLILVPLNYLEDPSFDRDEIARAAKAIQAKTTEGCNQPQQEDGCASEPAQEMDSSLPTEPNFAVFVPLPAREPEPEPQDPCKI